MKFPRFFSIIPKPIRITAFTLVAGGIVTGLILGLFWRTIEQLPYDPAEMMLNVLIGFGAGLVLSSLIAIWLLGLGYVYGDARRRAMRPGLWVLVAALFPHLLGFLLYFVMRQPIASSCPHCGLMVPLYQRFCSWCGSSQAAATASNVPPAVDQCRGAAQ